MSTLQSLPPKLDELTTEEFRQRLACLIDPQEQLSLEEREGQRLLAIQFVAVLPELFGDDLDRTTLWDRIATAIQTGYAKTVGDDHEFFVSEVLGHIKASPAAAARNERLADVIYRLGAQESEVRQAFMAYLATHLIPILVHARAEWEQRKTDKKGGAE